MQQETKCASLSPVENFKADVEDHQPIYCVILTKLHCSSLYKDRGTRVEYPIYHLSIED